MPNQFAEVLQRPDVSNPQERKDPGVGDGWSYRGIVPLELTRAQHQKLEQEARRLEIQLADSTRVMNQIAQTGGTDLPAWQDQRREVRLIANQLEQLEMASKIRVRITEKTVVFLPEIDPFIFSAELVTQAANQTSSGKARLELGLRFAGITAEHADDPKRRHIEVLYR